MTPRILIASDDQTVGREVRRVLTQAGLDCPDGQIVPLESAADRASRIIPELLVVVFPSDTAAGLAALRETCNTVHRAFAVVVGPIDNAPLIIQSLQEGADEYIDRAQIEKQLVASLVRWKNKQSTRVAGRDAGRVIGVLAPSGGSGASTVAANVSTVLAQNHGECGLIDLRLTAGDLASMLDLKPVHSVADLCQRLDRVDQSMFEQFFVKHSTGVHLLAAPADFSDVEHVSAKGIRRMLAMARVRFPYVVVDLDNVLSTEQVEALWQADVILLVLRLDYTSLRNARRTLETIAKLGIGADRVRAVVNGYGQASQLTVRQAEEAIGIKIAHNIPCDPSRANRAINRGMPLVLHRPNARISKCMRNLAVSVNGRHNGQ